MNDNTAAYLRGKAAQCRAMAAYHGGPARQSLLDLAAEFEVKATALEQTAERPADNPQHD